MNCKVCDKIFSGIECLKQHEASAKHKKKLLQHQAAENHISSYNGSVSSNRIPQNEDTIPCSACSKNFSSLQDYMLHALTEEHAKAVLEKNLESAPSPDTSELNSTIQPVLEIPVVDKPSSLSPFHEESNFLVDSPALVPLLWARCEKCDKNFSGPEPYQQHMDSPTHHKKILSAPNTGVPNSFLRCDVCDKLFNGPAPYDQHMKSEIHKKKVESKHFYSPKSEEKENNSIEVDSCMRGSVPRVSHNPLYCELCDKSCSGQDNYKQHLASAKHQKKVIKAGLEKKKVESLFSLQSSENSNRVSNQTNTEGDHGTKPVSLADSSNDIGEEIKDFLCEGGLNLPAIDPSLLSHFTFFNVDEEIDFDRPSTKNLEISQLSL